MLQQLNAPYCIGDNLQDTFIKRENLQILRFSAVGFNPGLRGESSSAEVFLNMANYNVSTV